MIKIALFPFGLFYEGGGERLVLEQMRGLEKKGHETACFAPILIKDKCYSYWINKFKIKALVPQWLNWFSGGMLIQMMTASWLTAFQFWRFFKFDVFVGIGQPGVWMAFCLSRILNKPYLAWMNQPTRFLYPRKIDIENGLRISAKKSIASRTIRILRPLVSVLDQISVAKADVLICNSKLVANWLKKVYQKKVIQNYPGGELNAKIKEQSQKRFQGKLRIKRKLINKPFLLVTNRHFPQKKFEYSIRLMPFLVQKIPDLNLVITGRENHHTEQLKILTYQLGLEKKVIFTGFVKEKDLKKLYSQTGVYLYVAPQEDYGMGVVEAMFTGTPVVAWDEAGPKETIVNNKTGYLIRPYDLDDFRKKVLSLLINKKLNKKMGQAGLKRAKKKFTWERHIDILEREIKKVITNY